MVSVLGTNRPLSHVWQFLDVELVVLLVLDVLLHRCFLDANGRNKVASTPETAKRKLLGLFLEPSTALALEDCHGVGYGVLWWNNDVEMDVVISNVPGSDLETLPFADQLEYSLQFCFDVGICQHFASVLGGPNQMVLAKIGGMIELV